MTKDAKNNGSHKSKTGTQDSDPFFSETNKHIRKTIKEDLNSHVSNSMSPPPNPNPKKDR